MEWKVWIRTDKGTFRFKVFKPEFFASLDRINKQTLHYNAANCLGIICENCPFYSIHIDSVYGCYDLLQLSKSAVIYSFSDSHKIGRFYE